MNYQYPLLTDMYEFTMLDSSIKDGTSETPTIFSVFTRTLPKSRRYGVLVGTGRILEILNDFKISDTTLKFLHDKKIVSDNCINWLKNRKFSFTIDGYREGSIYKENESLLYIRAPFGEAILIETLILSILNYDSAVASAAARMFSVSNGRKLFEMGGRRTNEISAVNAARASYIAGFNGTSNLECSRLYSVPAIGTVSHAFIMLHETEKDAFLSQLKSMGENSTFLVDTYNIENAIKTLVDITNSNIGAIRIDSGDLGEEVKKARSLLDSLGCKKTKIVVTSDLDEFQIAYLSSFPVDAYGVGTRLVVGSKAPTCSFVYKMVMRQSESGEWINTKKESLGKTSLGGAPENKNHISLMKDSKPDSSFIGPKGVESAREHFLKSFTNLSFEDKRLSAKP